MIAHGLHLEVLNQAAPLQHIAMTSELLTNIISHYFIVIHYLNDLYIYNKIPVPVINYSAATEEVLVLLLLPRAPPPPMIWMPLLTSSGSSVMRMPLARRSSTSPMCFLSLVVS